MENVSKPTSTLFTEKRQRIGAKSQKILFHKNEQHRRNNKNSSARASDR